MSCGSLLHGGREILLPPGEGQSERASEGKGPTEGQGREPRHTELERADVLDSLEILGRARLVSSVEENGVTVECCV